MMSTDMLGSIATCKLRTCPIGSIQIRVFWYEATLSGLIVPCSATLLGDAICVASVVSNEYRPRAVNAYTASPARAAPDTVAIWVTFSPLIGTLTPLSTSGTPLSNLCAYLNRFG